MRSTPRIKTGGAALALVAVASIVVLPRTGRADCAMQILSQAGGSVDSVAYAGTRAVFGQGPTLVVADIANPANVTELGRIRLPGLIFNIAMAGNTAYVADFDGGLQIVDISAPANPQIIGTLTAGLRLTQVALNGQYAYVYDVPSVGAANLKVVSIANPVAPMLVGGTLNTDVQNMTLTGTKLYCAEGDTGIVNIISVANPTAPVWVGGISAGTDAWDCVVSGNNAFVAAGPNGLKVYNVANPAFVTPVTTFAGTTPYRLALAGTRIYSGEGVGMKAVNIANPAAPSVLGTYSQNDFYPHAMAISGTNVLVGASVLFQIVNAANPAAMAPLGAIVSDGFDWDVETFGNYAYVAASTGLVAFDVTNPFAPIRLSTTEFAGTPYGLKREGLIMYVGQYYGLEILSLQDPAHPAPLGSVGLGWTNRPTIVGSTVYVTDASNLRILNAFNPANVTTIGSCALPYGGNKIALSGNYAYISAGLASKVNVVNIANPASPQVVTTLDADNWTNGIAVSGGRLYVCQDYAGIKIFSLANPAAPSVLGTYDTLGYAEDIEVIGNRAYIADGNRGVTILDVTNAVAPTLVDHAETSWSANGIAVSAQRMFVSDNEGGLVIFQRCPFGDMNCDGLVNLQDVAPFAQALTQPVAYQAAYPNCSPLNGDMNNDGLVNGKDAQLFSQALVAP